MSKWNGRFHPLISATSIDELLRSSSRGISESLDRYGVERVSTPRMTRLPVLRHAAAAHGDAGVGKDLTRLLMVAGQTEHEQSGEAAP